MVCLFYGMVEIVNMLDYIINQDVVSTDKVDAVYVVYVRAEKGIGME